MRFASSFLILTGLIAAGVSMHGQASPKSPVAGLVDTYCATCHNGSTRSPSGVLLDPFDARHIADQPDVWSRVYRHLQAGTMPPVGAPRPDRATYDVVLKSIEQQFTSKPDATLHEPTSGQIAERLAKLLWDGVPDAPLLQDAQRNRLIEPSVLERQIHRMLADGRAETFVTKFFVPWLGLDKLSTADPDKNFFPDYDVSLRDAFRKETELFLLSQLRDDRDPVEIWSANYSFVNDQLAQHYNIPNVNGSQFRKVTLPTPERSGLLGQGSVLMATSRHQHGAETYTSPAARSVWIRLHFLGVPPPNPFPGALPVKPELPITPQTRALPLEPCVTCHRNFFPLGYALENFDPIGRWRTQDQVGPVDASGTFVDGTPTNGVVELRKVLLQRPEAFRTTITEALVNYASGKPPARTPESLIRARQILRGLQRPRWAAIIAGVARESN